eukprot:825042-Rhodomonas_salina.1
MSWKMIEANIDKAGRIFFLKVTFPLLLPALAEQRLAAPASSLGCLYLEIALHIRSQIPLCARCLVASGGRGVGKEERKRGLRRLGGEKQDFLGAGWWWFRQRFQRCREMLRGNSMECVSEKEPSREIPEGGVKPGAGFRDVPRNAAALQLQGRRAAGEQRGAAAAWPGTTPSYAPTPCPVLNAGYGLRHVGYWRRVCCYAVCGTGKGYAATPSAVLTEHMIYYQAVMEMVGQAVQSLNNLSLIHISEPTRPRLI